MASIYLAGPLFTQAEQNWLKGVKAQLLAQGHAVCWPFELFAEGEIASWQAEGPRRIMERCRDAVDAADTVVAWLDGTQVDDGTAWELGYAHARGKRIVGIRTDFRQGGDTKHSLVNAMIEGACQRICRSVPELLRTLDPGD